MPVGDPAVPLEGNEAGLQGEEADVDVPLPLLVLLVGCPGARAGGSDDRAIRCLGGRRGDGVGAVVDLLGATRHLERDAHDRIGRGRGRRGRGRGRGRRDRGRGRRGRRGRDRRLGRGRRGRRGARRRRGRPGRISHTRLRVRARGLDVVRGERDGGAGRHRNALGQVRGRVGRHHVRQHVGGADEDVPFHGVRVGVGERGGGAEAGRARSRQADVDDARGRLVSGEGARHEAERHGEHSGGRHEGGAELGQLAGHDCPFPPGVPGVVVVC